MSEHVTRWLGAYLDGELGGLRLRQVEDHLTRCATCRAELAELRSLAALLQESLAPAALTAPDRFMAQVGLGLRPRPAQPTWRRALGMGWRLAPLGLLGAWAFGQAVLIVSRFALAALRLGFGSDVLAAWLPAPPDVLYPQASWLTLALGLPDASLNDVARVLASVLRDGGPLGWLALLNLALLVLIGLMYWSWLASWWARRQHQPH